MHLAHRIDPSRVRRGGKFDLINGNFASYRSKGYLSEISNQDAFGGSGIGNGLSRKQLTGGRKRSNACRYVDGRSKQITRPADDRPMVQRGPRQRQARFFSARLQQRSKRLDRDFRLRK